MAKRRWKWWDTTRRDPTAYMHVQHMVPNVSGNYETCRIPVAWGSSNTVAAGGYIVSDAFQKTDGTARLFAASGTRLYEVTSSSITDRSAGGSAYTSASFWSATQYGDVTIYSSFENAPQSSSSGAFAALSGSPPKAKFCCTQSLAVALAYYNDGVNTYKDGIWISDIGDQTTWTPASTNQAANFRLLQTPGPITGIVPFKGDILAFKKNSLYRISYVGRPIIWQAQLISDNIGAEDIGCVCVCDNAIVFGGLMGWYMYDGANLEQIAPGRMDERMGGAGLIGQARGTFAVGGPYLAAYVGGTTFYWAEAGLALFHPNGGNAITAPIIAVQVKDGGGKGAIGAFVPVISGAISSLNSNGCCFVRGTQAAVVAAGIGTDSTYSQSWPGIWCLVSSIPTPYTLSGAFSVTGASGYDAFVQTSFIGDQTKKTSWNRVYPELGWYTSNNGFSSLLAYTAQRANLTDASMGSTGQFSGIADSDSASWTFAGSNVSRFVCFQFNTTGAIELGDIIIDSSPVGSK